MGKLDWKGCDFSHWWLFVIYVRFLSVCLSLRPFIYFFVLQWLHTISKLLSTSQACNCGFHCDGIAQFRLPASVWDITMIYQNWNCYDDVSQKWYMMESWVLWISDRKLQVVSHSLVWYTGVKRPTRHSIGHFGVGGPEQWCAPPIQW